MSALKTKLSGAEQKVVKANQNYINMMARAMDCTQFQMRVTFLDFYRWTGSVSKAKQIIREQAAGM